MKTIPLFKGTPPRFNPPVPRTTRKGIEAEITAEYYFTAAEGAEFSKMAGRIKEVDDNVALSVLTFCVLVLRNGFTVTGESSCVSPADFDAELGRRLAREHAVSKLWPVFDYMSMSAMKQEHCSTL